MNPVVVHSLAKTELGKARRWYDSRQPGLGQRLLDEVLSALNKIERDPMLGIQYGNTHFRFYCLHRFPYVIYYELFPDCTQVVAIAHERRRPDYWQKRKRK